MTSEGRVCAVAAAGLLSPGEGFPELLSPCLCPGCEGSAEAVLLTLPDGLGPEARTDSPDQK